MPKTATSGESPPRCLLLRRSDPRWRAVLSDWLTERRRAIQQWLPYHYSDEDKGFGDGSGGDGDGWRTGSGGGGGVSNYDDDGSSGVGGSEGCGGGGEGGYSGGYSRAAVLLYGGFGDGGRGGCYGYKCKEDDLRNGLVIISLPGGNYPYVLIGWIRTVEGDELELVGARCIRRFGTNASLAGLAARGPLQSQPGVEPTVLLEASAQPEIIHRLVIGRCLPCNEQAWAKECPRPEGWEEF